MRFIIILRNFKYGLVKVFLPVSYNTNTPLLLKYTINFTTQIFGPCFGPFLAKPKSKALLADMLQIISGYARKLLSTGKAKLNVDEKFQRS
jgi:hypothetical protein